MADGAAADESTARAMTLRRPLVVVAMLGLGALLAIGYWYSPNEASLDGGSNYLLVFLTGLTVGGLSCLAVQAGLLTAAVARPEDQELGGIERRMRREAALQGNAEPILWFLGAKLVTYTALGAGLGWLGSLISPSPTLRGIVMALTAMFMLAIALHLLGVHPIFRYAIIQPPRFLTKRIRNQARSRAAFTPAFLGALTIFLPCGFTQAMQLLAINSGSAAMGAAIMFAFILGTTPVFFLLGYSATKLGEGLQRGFTRFAGALVVLIALYTLNASMNLLQLPVSYDAVKDSLTADGPSVAAVQAADKVQQVVIHAGARGYSPARVSIEAGKKARIIFVTESDAGCSRAFVFQGKEYVLPATGRSVLRLPPQEAGTIRYVCTMGMFRGTIKVI
jgi:sulfite exporter TauE/SafE